MKPRKPGQKTEGEEEMEFKQNLISWDDNLLLGIPVIDNQHQELVAIANRLHNLVCEGDECTDYLFIHSAYAMVDYMHCHFSTEEKLMRLLDFPGAAEHKKEHDDFVKELLDISDQFYEEKELVPHRFTAFFKVWILSHIADYDKNFAEFVLNQRQKRAMDRIPDAEPQQVLLFS